MSTPNQAPQPPPAERSARFLCVPNLSEGRRDDLIDQLVLASRDPEVRLLDRTSLPDHHRTALTLLVSSDGLVQSITALVHAAFDRLDLRLLQGVHPRLGVVDVVPFVPLAGVSMRDAVQLARRLAAQLADAAPVFLYERAAPRPERRELAAHRRGGLPKLIERMRDGSWPPDHGAATVDPARGVLVIGARGPLIAFNVDLDAADPAAARRIASRIRQSAPGGLRGVKALGLALPTRGVSQVSMNVVDPSATSLLRIVERIREEARREGVELLASELIGLMPEQAALGALSEALGLPGLGLDKIVEHHLAATPARATGE